MQPSVGTPAASSVRFAMHQQWIHLPRGSVRSEERCALVDPPAHEQRAIRGVVSLSHHELGCMVRLPLNDRSCRHRRVMTLPVGEPDHLVSLQERAPRLLPRGRSLARAKRTRASGAPGRLAIISWADGLYPSLHCTHCIKA